MRSFVIGGFFLQSVLSIKSWRAGASLEAHCRRARKRVGSARVGIRSGKLSRNVAKSSKPIARRDPLAPLRTHVAAALSSGKKWQGRGPWKISRSAKNALNCVAFVRTRALPERWPSGRRRSPAKGVGGQPSRGFESLPLRHPTKVFTFIQCDKMAEIKEFWPRSSPGLFCRF